MKTALERVTELCKSNTYLLDEVEVRGIIEQWQKDIDEKNKVLELNKCAVSGSFSAEYLAFIKQAELPPLTNTQHYFAEWLIKNEDRITQIGDLEIIFIKVRRWLKNLH